MRSPVKPLKASVFVGPGIGQAPNWLSRIAADELEAPAGDVSCLTDCFGLTFLKSCATTSSVSMVPSGTAAAPKQEANFACLGP